MQLQRDNAFVIDTNPQPIPENPFPTLRKVQSFTILEDAPLPEFRHVDDRIQRAVSPATLVVDKDGNQYLLVDRK